MTMKQMAKQTAIFVFVTERRLFVALASRRRFLKQPTKRKAAGETPAPQNHPRNSDLDMGVVE
jgi:hypothetical protein